MEEFMSAKIVSTENSIVKLEISIEGAPFREAINNAYKKDRQHYDVQGFRKGKVPRKVIEAHYGKIFYEQAIENAFPKAYGDALKETEIKPISRPSISEVKKADEDGAVFIVEVAIRPEVKLGEYKGAEIEPLEVEVLTEDVDEAIEKMREQNARVITIEDEAAILGDTVKIDYKGMSEGVAFEGGEAQDHELELGSNAFIPGFEEQLVGAKTGDEVEVKVTFPEEYHAPDLAGKDAVFAVTVKNVQRKELPELDDEFAKDVSEFDTLEELRADEAKKLKETKTKEQRQKAEIAAIDFALENAELELADMVVEDEVENSMNDMKSQLSQMGITLEQYAQYTGSDLKQLRESMKPNAEKNLKVDFVLSAIADAEKVEYTDEEMEAEVEKMAAAYSQKVEEFKEKAFNDNMKEYLATSIKRHKVIDMLVEVATEKQGE